MNVFTLIEECGQEECKNRHGKPAAPIYTLIGIYADREKAERDKESFVRASKENAEKYDADECTYYIEERPVL